MFNNTVNNAYSKNIVSTHISAISGGISKTYRKSFFQRFNLKSGMADKLLGDNPHIMKKKYSKYTESFLDEKVPAVIIQMTICGDMEVIAEIMLQEDYDNMMEETNGQ